MIRSWVLPMLLIMAFGASAATPGPGAYAGDPGAYVLAPQRELRLGGSTPLRVRATFPGNAQGPLPVIIFSHGVWGSAEQYQPIVRHWASHGYVCLQPQHGDTIPPQQRGTGTANRAFSGWRERAAQIGRLLDAVETPHEAWQDLGMLMDARRVGLAGHSFGAHIAQLLGGTRMIVDRQGRTVSLVDERIDAVVMFAPRGRGAQLDEHAWREFDVPFMAVTGSNDIARLRLGEDVAWRLDPFRLATASPRYLLFINGAYNNFGGLTQTAIRFEGWGEPNAQHARYALDFTTAFWDAQLRRLPTATHYLRERAGSERITSTTPVILLDDADEVPTLLRTMPPHRVPRTAIRPDSQP